MFIDLSILLMPFMFLCVLAALLSFVVFVRGYIYRLIFSQGNSGVKCVFQLLNFGFVRESWGDVGKKWDSRGGMWITKKASTEEGN